MAGVSIPDFWGTIDDDESGYTLNEITMAVEAYRQALKHHEIIAAKQTSVLIQPSLKKGKTLSVEKLIGDDDTTAKKKTVSEYQKERRARKRDLSSDVLKITRNRQT